MYHWRIRGAYLFYLFLGVLLGLFVFWGFFFGGGGDF